MGCLTLSRAELGSLSEVHKEDVFTRENTVFNCLLDFAAIIVGPYWRGIAVSSFVPFMPSTWFKANHS